MEQDDLRTTGDHGTTTLRTGALTHFTCLAVVVSVIVVLVLVSELVSFLDDGVLDDHLFAYYGWMLSKGATLYRDVWDHKPPGVYWLNHLGMTFGGHYGGMLFFCALAQYASIGLLYFFARILHGRAAAVIIALLGAIYLTNSAFFGGSNRGETFLVPFELGLVVFYLLAWRREKRLCWVIAGMCGGAALLMKQTGGAALAAAGAHLAWTAVRRDLNFATAARRFSLMLAGVASVIGVSAVVLASQGVLGEAATAIFSVNRAYLAIETTDPLSSAWWWVRLERSSLWLLKLPILLAAGSMCLGLLDRRAAKNITLPDAAHAAARCPRPMSLLAFWLIAAAIGAVAGPMVSTHYMLPVLPPLLLMGGPLIQGHCQQAGSPPAAGRRAWLAAAVVFAGYLAWEPLYLQAQKATVVYSQREFDFRDGEPHMLLNTAERVGFGIAAGTDPDDRILCWDYLPGVMLAAKRPPASRFPSRLHARVAEQVGTASPTEFMDALREENTHVVVMSSATWRRMSEVNSAVPRSPRESEIEQWIQYHFEHRPELSGENIVVLVRRSASTGPA